MVACRRSVPKDVPAVPIAPTSSNQGLARPMHVPTSSSASSHVQPVGGQNGLLTRVRRPSLRTSGGRSTLQQLISLCACKSNLLIEAAELAAYCRFVRKSFGAPERRPQCSTARRRTNP